MCCDNTMFGRVIVTKWESLRLGRKGIDVTTYDDGERSFDQACPRLTDGGCGIYKSRPHTCRAYICEMLKELRSGAIDGAEAQARIDRVQAAKAALLPQAEGKDLFLYRNAITDALEAGAEPNTLAGCTPELVELESLLNQWFRTEDYAKRVPSQA